MKIAPLADVKARLSAYVDECGVDGPIVMCFFARWIRKPDSSRIQ